MEGEDGVERIYASLEEEKTIVTELFTELSNILTCHETDTSSSKR